jgi:hypothetical protein
MKYSKYAVDYTVKMLYTNLNSKNTVKRKALQRCNANKAGCPPLHHIARDLFIISLAAKKEKG